MYTLPFQGVADSLTSDPIFPVRIQDHTSQMTGRIRNSGTKPRRHCFEVG